MKFTPIRVPNYRPHPLFLAIRVGLGLDLLRAKHGEQGIARWQLARAQA